MIHKLGLPLFGQRSGATVGFALFLDNDRAAVTK